jgi:spore maturation protein SpmA
VRQVAERVGRGPGRLLVAVYAVFAVAASSRAVLQLATRFDEAPVAYLLSAVAAAVYLVAAVALGLGMRRLALAAVLFELVGVLVVGTLSLVLRDAFPDETVWSAYGIGYGFVPLVLPVLGLLRLRTTR